MISVVSESAAVTAKSTAPSSSSSSSPNASASTFDLNDDLDEDDSAKFFPGSIFFFSFFMRWPVNSLAEVATPLCVSGTPALDPTPLAAVIPGITLTSNPFSRKNSHSSPPRPNTNGSPPFNLTTVAPALANSSIKS